MTEDWPWVFIAVAFTAGEIFGIAVAMISRYYWDRKYLNKMVENRLRRSRPWLPLILFLLCTPVSAQSWVGWVNTTPIHVVSANVRPQPPLRAPTERAVPGPEAPLPDIVVTLGGQTHTPSRPLPYKYTSNVPVGGGITINLTKYRRNRERNKKRVTFASFFEETDKNKSTQP